MSAKIKYIFVLAIVLIFVISITANHTFAPGSIVQSQCTRNASVANDQVITAQFTSRPAIGDFVYAVITVQGTTTQTISYTNVTDNTDLGGLNPQYTHQFRTTDQGNTLIVSFQNYTVDTNNAGINFIVSGSYHATTNQNNRFIICIYELTGLVKTDPVKTSQKSGGSLPQATGTTGDVTLTGAAGNSAGGAYTFTGTVDFNDGNQAVGHGTGSWNGLTGITFVEEGDLSIGNTTTTTLTITAWNTIGVQTSATWIVLALMLFFFPAITWGILKGFNAAPSTTVFATLLSLVMGSLIGVIGDYEAFQAGSNGVLPYGIVIFQIIALAVFIFRANRRGNISF